MYRWRPVSSPGSTSGKASSKIRRARRQDWRQDNLRDGAAGGPGELFFPVLFYSPEDVVAMCDAYTALLQGCLSKDVHEVRLEMEMTEAQAREEGTRAEPRGDGGGKAASEIATALVRGLEVSPTLPSSSTDRHCRSVARTR